MTILLSPATVGAQLLLEIPPTKHSPLQGLVEVVRVVHGLGALVEVAVEVGGAAMLVTPVVLVIPAQRVIPETRVLPEAPPAYL
jgi:hypothetical protein